MLNKQKEVLNEIENNENLYSLYQPLDKQLLFFKVNNDIDKKDLNLKNINIIFTEIFRNKELMESFITKFSFNDLLLFFKTNKNKINKNSNLHLRLIDLLSIYIGKYDFSYDMIYNFIFSIKNIVTGENKMIIINELNNIFHSKNLLKYQLNEENKNYKLRINNDINNINIKTNNNQIKLKNEKNSKNKNLIIKEQ